MNWLYFLLAGFISGMISGMGMGGGTVLIPVLTIFLSVEQHAAQGMNMLIFLPCALLALLVHKREGRVDKKKGVPFLLYGMLGAVIGALFASLLSSDWLARAFGVFLIVLAFVQWKKSGLKS